MLFGLTESLLLFTANPMGRVCLQNADQFCHRPVVILVCLCVSAPTLPSTEEGDLLPLRPDIHPPLLSHLVSSQSLTPPHCGWIHYLWVPAHHILDHRLITCFHQQHPDQHTRAPATLRGRHPRTITTPLLDFLDVEEPPLDEPNSDRGDVELSEEYKSSSRPPPPILFSLNFVLGASEVVPWGAQSRLPVKSL